MCVVRQVLLLNMGGEVLDVIPWTKAISLHLREEPKVAVCASYDDIDIHFGSGAMKQPSVVMLKRYVHLDFEKRVAINKRNLMLRDESICQFCGKPVTNHSASIDHVVPTSRGGKHIWRNVVLACKTCNTAKGNRTPDEASMPLRRVPFTPSREMFFVRYAHKPGYDTWQPFFKALGAL